MKKTLFALFVALFATTGLLASEITPEGMEQLKTEWLFQCDDEPTFEKAKLEIGYARDLADRISDLDDAPEFENDVAADTIYRYVAISNVYPVVLAGGAEDAKLTFSLLQGKLPAGLKATTAGTGFLCIRI